MQTIFIVKIHPSLNYPWENYQDVKLSAMLELGAKVLHVTLVLEVNTAYSTTYTDSLRYVLEEPDTNEYKKAKLERFQEIQENINSTHNPRLLCPRYTE